MKSKQSRRQFLIKMGWVAGGITVLGVGSCSVIPPLPTFKVTPPDDINSWVQLKPDGRILFYVPRAEMGQGISTGLAQIVAEEMNVPLSQIDCHYQSTAVMAPCQMTVGSQSMENYWRLTAQSAATLRVHLQALAAEHLAVAAAEIRLVESGFETEQGLHLQYKELLPNSSIVLTAQASRATVTLLSERDNSECTSIGKSVVAVNLDRIITGQETYSRDKRIDGMLHGQVLHPPQLGVALLAFDKAAAESEVDVIAVVEFDDQVGVIAETPMAVAKGILALSPRWSNFDINTGALEQEQMDIDVSIEQDTLDHELLDTGSDSASSADTTSLSMRFDTPMVAHAAMEPRSALAHWHTNEKDHTVCDIWTACQDPWLVQSTVSKLLSVGRSHVTVHNLRLGGGFGGRVVCQAALEAACLSKAVDKPVKVQWSREDEFRYNYVGPQFSTRIDAQLTADGRIGRWHHRAVASPILTSSAFIPSYLHWAVDKLPDPGTSRGMVAPYTISDKQVDFADVRITMPTGPWRGLGAAPNAFAVESAMDELANKAAKHPIDFRLEHTDDERFIAVLERIKQMTSSEPTVGYAATIYKEVTYVAVAALVVLEGGRPLVQQLWCVHDCGRVISPNQVRAQIEGNLVWGVGMALQEQFRFENGIASTLNFDTYRLPRQMDMPKLAIELIDSRHAPSGAAEAALAPAAASIANALFAMESALENAGQPTAQITKAHRYRRLPIHTAKTEIRPSG